MAEVAIPTNEQDAEAKSAREVAENILVWAKQNNLFQRVPEVVEAVEDTDYDQEMLPTQLFTAQTVADILRKRSINLVGFNEKERKVVIFTNARLPKAEQKFLPFHFSGGIEIDYVTGGIASVKGGSHAPDRGAPYALKNEAVCCGSSIHPVNCIGAGTFGAVVRDAGGDLFGLTNNHVSGACNFAAPGLPILCPGPLDANENHMAPFTIGRHSKLLPITEGIPENIEIAKNADAAIFKLEDPSRVSSFQGESYDTPSTARAAEAGMRVEKHGRTTGLTTGRIIAQSASPVPVQYAIKEYGIAKTVFFPETFIVQGDNESAFSKPGDSGSLVIGYDDTGSRHSVGLVFAGDERRGLSFVLSLPPILYDLGVELVDGHNT